MSDITEVEAVLKVSPKEKRMAHSALKKHHTAKQIILCPIAIRWHSVSVIIGSALEIRVPINVLIVELTASTPVDI
ncbi:hypothetical protein OF83DRAFT_1174883 [Amylostereum chailletii]|nr:hypothetical protein OF83DRAFT_1174883 [Amylostereum chailletii]